MAKPIFFALIGAIGLSLILSACMSKSPALTSSTSPASEFFDWQGHRGARGLAPENSIPGFLKALDFPEVKTLELDLAVTADQKLVVSHEPWFSAEISSHPDGRPVLPEEEEALLIYKMTYEEAARYDCGRRGHARFPEQQPQPAAKPLLRDVVRQANRYARQQGRALPLFNIEIKSEPAWDGERCPPPAAFAQLVIQEIYALGLAKRVIVQSFDVRPLQELRKRNNSIPIALLVENDKPFEENMEALGFTPFAYSPHHPMVTAELVTKAHTLGVRVIPWTVNEPADMRRLLALGVDGIITDYPNRIKEAR